MKTKSKLNVNFMIFVYAVEKDENNSNEIFVVPALGQH